MLDNGVLSSGLVSSAVGSEVEKSASRVTAPARMTSAMLRICSPDDDGSSSGDDDGVDATSVCLLTIITVTIQNLSILDIWLAGRESKAG